MIKEIIKVESEYYKIHIPKEYLNKKVEITVLPIEQEDGTKLLEKTSGIFKKKIDPIKWQREIRNDRKI